MSDDNEALREVRCVKCEYTRSSCSPV
jgi:hypothetical protein